MIAGTPTKIYSSFVDYSYYYLYPSYDKSMIEIIKAYWIYLSSFLSYPGPRRQARNLELIYRVAEREREYG